MSSPEWADARDPDAYDDRWADVEHPHGEADLVASYGPRRVLDGGCGTGRVAIELARRGVAVLGVDADPEMVAVARAKAPELEWVVADLADLSRPERFDVVVLAGNVVPFAVRRAELVAACARHLVPGGRLVAGFGVQPGWPTPEEYDGWCAAAGLRPVERWATWERAPYGPGADYAVSVAVSASAGS